MNFSWIRCIVPRIVQSGSGSTCISDVEFTYTSKQSEPEAGWVNQGLTILMLYYRLVAAAVGRDHGVMMSDPPYLRLLKIHLMTTRVPYVWRGDEDFREK